MSEKTDLQEKARTLGLDDKGTIAELKARIGEREAKINGVADTAVVKAEATTPDGPAAALAKTEPAAADAPPAADALEPDPEAAQAVYDAVLEELEAKKRKALADQVAARQKAEKQKIKDAVKQMKGDRPAEEPSRDEQREAEQAGKESSLAGIDRRDSVFDAAPGKSLDDVLERNAARAAGQFTDTPTEELGIQYYVVSDELDLIEVSRKLGFHDHSELAALNGRYSGILGVQRGQRIVLPSKYRFTDVEGVITEGDESDELAGTEATA